jgi:hypothetical protein
MNDQDLAVASVIAMVLSETREKEEHFAGLALEYAINTGNEKFINDTLKLIFDFLPESTRDLIAVENRL